MTRIYFNPTKPKPHIPSSKAAAAAAASLKKRNHHKDTDNAHVKHNHHHSTTHPNTSNPNLNSSSNHNHSNNLLDPSAIEQIADGLEKMVRSWSHPHQYVVSNHFRCTDLIIDNSGNGNGVVIDGDGCDGDAVNRYAGQEGNASLISSDTIKSATMELHEDGEFSIGTKETTISYIHQRDMHHQQQHHPQHLVHNVHHHMHNPHHHQQQQHFQQTRIVDVSDENDGFLHEVLGGRGGDDVENRLLSIKNGQSCEAMDSYPSMGNGVWYLNPPLMTPNTAICSGKEHENCDTCQASMRDDDDGDVNNGRADLQRQNIKPGSGCRHQEKRRTKPEKLSCKLEVGDTNTWSETVEINGGNKIKELLGKKLTTSSNDVGSIQGTNAPDLDYYKKKVEELQIALLECAMEYEVKIVEMKMEALQTKSHEQRIEPSKEKDAENSRKGNRHEAQRVEYLKKQLSRLQHEKAMSARELGDLRKRERQFDLQRRSLDDALCRVNFLQSELAKKEQDILDCQLREKEAKAQLYELQLGLQKAQAAQIEPRKLLTLLPALKDWIHSTKKGPDNPSDHNPPIDNIVYAITKEIQMLQSALSHISNRA